MINRENKKLVDEYLDHRKALRMNHKTVRLDKSNSVHYLTWCAENDFSNAPTIEPSFADYVEALDYSQNYTRKLIGSAKVFFEWLSINKSGYRSITPAWLSLFNYKEAPEEIDNERTVSEEEIAIISKLPVETLVEQRVRAGACFLYLSAMRISAFVTMPIRAVNLEEMEVRQSPALGMITKNRKSATTDLLKIQEIVTIVREWDSFVRSKLSPDDCWFAPLNPTTGEIELTPANANENRSNLFRKNLNRWLEENGCALHTPHDFRRGFANYLYDRAKDYSDLDALRADLMHKYLSTTELYARKKRSQIKSRIKKMVAQDKAVSENQDLKAEIAYLTSLVTQLTSIVKEQRNEK